MIWLLLLGMSLITFINRYLFLSDSISYLPGPKFTRFLSYSSYSVLTAIWAPIVFHFDGGNVSIEGWDYLLAASLAALLSVYKVPSIVVVLLSVSVFFLIRFYLI